MGSLIWPYPWWSLAGCLLIGLLIAAVVYVRSPEWRERGPWIRWGLFGLRTVLATLLALLCLSPLLKRVQTEWRKPVIVFALDASASMAADSRTPMVGRELREMADRLSGDFDVKTLTFGDHVRAGVVDSFPDKETDIDQLLTYVHDVLGQDNLGGIVLQTDGIYNTGANPRYHHRLFAAPVFPVAMGDATPRRDAGIRRIFNNTIAYQDDKVQFQVDLQGTHASPGRTQLTVSEIRNGQAVKILSEPVELDTDPFFQTRDLTLDAGKPGVHHFRFTLNALDGEANTANNSRDVYLEVLDTRQKVLILADAPHPDVSALQQCLSANRNYDVEVRFGTEEPPSLRDVDLVILHQVPSVRQMKAPLLQALNQAKVPVWLVLGGQSDIQTLPAWQGLLAIGREGSGVNEVQAILNDGFRLFTLDANVRQELGQFPPLESPFGQYRPDPAGQVLLYQRIGAVTTEYPLWMFGENRGVKMAVLAGEGLWKWRLFDFLQHGNHELVDELIRKTVQYLSLKEDKRRFRVRPVRQVFEENDPIVLEGELYNRSFELVNDPDVQLVLKDEDGREYPFTLNRTGQLYALEAGLFPPGNYSFAAKTLDNGETLTAEGRLTVRAVDVELTDLRADHDLLQGIADESGGAVFLPDSLSRLEARLASDQRFKPVMYSNMDTTPVISLRWLFGLFILLLALEWGIRRYLGTY